MDLTEALKLARSGRALIFLGAGFSVGTPNAADDLMKSGQGFSDHLAQGVGLPAGTGLMDTSEAYLEKYGSTSLIGQLKTQFTATALLPHQLALPIIPWKQIYTTNYDNIVEKSYATAKIKLATVNPDSPIAGLNNNIAACIHLNGSIIDITSDKLASQIKLTDSSYLTSSLAESEWAVRFRQDIEAAQAVFYVGYSTYDIDIARLLFAKSSLKIKSFFVVGSSVDAILRRRIDKFGTDTQLDAAGFFTEIVKDAYAPSSLLSLAEHCIRTYNPQGTNRAYRDEDAFNLFRLGRLFEEFAFESVVSGLRYVLNRRQADQAINLIKTSSSGIIIHSSLGNGKTMILESIKAKAYIEGFTVIEILRQQNQLFEELEFALKRPERLLFIVDNYGNWLDALKFIGNHRGQNVSVILASRSGTNDVLASRASELLKGGDTHEIAADHLTDLELIEVIKAMDTYGLWGSRASLSMQDKLTYLSRHCDREWQAILVELFKAPQIKERLDKLIDGIKGEKTYNLVLITILILAIIDIPATTSNLTDLCGEKTLTVGFRQNETVRELIDFESDEVRLRSAVTGGFVLRHVADPQTVLECLVTITKAADRAASASREYMTILATIMRFGNAQSFFSENDRTDLVLRYYEAVKQLYHCKRSPLFWLQYAMACLFMDDFTRAEKYFESAYSFAKATNFNTYQIDNHYARFLLRRSINNNEPTTAMEDFRNARTLIFEQMRRERLHYPYRVAYLIGEWHDAYSDRLSEENLAEVKRAVTFISNRILSLPNTLQQQRDVADCFKKMQLILKES